ncbi:MAG: ArnT family glycosyltransferase, partial [Thermodesulfobacteriota bacterium]
MTINSNPENWLKDYLLLILILLLYGINTYYLTSLDREPPKWDESVHLRDSLVFYNVLSNPFQINLEIIKEIINKSEQYPLLRPSGYYPPFTTMLTSIFYFIFGTSSKIAVMSNMISLLILVFSIYGIGTLFFYRKIGLLASILTLLFPIVLSNSIVYMLDLSLTAMASLGIYTLIRTEYFKNTSFSIISGIVFGLGMLTKWTFLFFLLGPLCYFLIAAFYSENTPDNISKNLLKPISNIILFVFASVCTFGPYYFPILPNLIEETLKYSQGVLAHGPDTLFSFA